MSFELETLELLKELEKEHDLGFTPLPADSYRFEISDASKIVRQSKTNEPRFQISNTVLASKIGESDGKTHVEFLGWFGRQDVEAKTKALIEEMKDNNNKNARRRTVGFWHDFIKAIANNPDSDGEVVGGILLTLKSLTDVTEFTEENFELVDAAFQNILMLAEGMDYYAAITRTMKKDDVEKVKAEVMAEEDATWYTNIRPMDYDKGRSEVADQLSIDSL